MKRCSICKKAEYCGAECHKVGWKQHKKICVPPLDADSVLQKLSAAASALDWREALKWEGRMEELMSGRSTQQERLLGIFSRAHNCGLGETGKNVHVVSVVRLDEQRVELLGNMERFRDQGECLCVLANCVFLQGKDQESAKYYQRARDIGAAHGFILLECTSCQGLGHIAMRQGRHEEAVLLYQNALAAAPLCEGCEAGCVIEELKVLNRLTEALLKTNSVDEVEPLVERYRSLFEAGIIQAALLRSSELHILYVSARMHEVLCISNPCWKTRCRFSARTTADSIASEVTRTSLRSRPSKDEQTH